MELYGYTITHNKDGWTAIKPGEIGNIPEEEKYVPEIALFISDEFLKKENGKENPLKETRLLDLIYLRLLNENHGEN